MYGAIFPGQGSQFVGMGEFLIKHDSLKQGRMIFEEASDTLGFDMKKLCLEGPESDLRLTYNTQPALLTLSYATYAAAQERSPFEVTACAGHSVGEYAALVVTEALPFAKALELVRLRGELMQKTVPVGEGGMLAVIGLDAEEVQALCQWAEKESGMSPIEPANYNSPQQTVVSGNMELIKWTAKNFSADKIGSSKPKVRLIPLKVSAPFHCSMMMEAEKEMAAAINETTFNDAKFAIVQNFTAKAETSQSTIKQNLISQISGAVRWVECVQTLSQSGVTMAGEFGPGTVLAGLVKKIQPEMKVLNLSDQGQFDAFCEQVEAGLAPAEIHGEL